MMKLSFNRKRDGKAPLLGFVLHRGPSPFDPLNYLNAVNLRVFCGHWTLDWHLYRTPKWRRVAADGSIVAARSGL